MNHGAVFLFQAVLVVHALDGQEVLVNMRAITTVIHPGPTHSPDAKCVINLVDGKFVPTQETCDRLLTLAASAPTGGFLDSR
jgi:hypothetical protein